MLSIGKSWRKETKFWKWFEVNEQLLLNFEADQQKVFELLAAQLKRIDADLTFEFGPLTDGKRQLVISADGHKTAFPAVEALVEAAPPLARWSIVKFRQRTTIDFILNFNGRDVDPHEVEAAVDVVGDKVRIAMYFLGYENEDHEVWDHIGYLLLDSLLGEYDVEMKVGAIEFFPYETHSERRRFPLTELAATFDAAYVRLLQ